MVLERRFIKPLFKEVKKVETYKGYKVYVVNRLFGISQAQYHDSDLYIDDTFHLFLTEMGLLENVLDHEIRELELVKKGVPYAIAHNQVIAEEDPEKRKRVIFLNWLTHREKAKELFGK
jgi:hypothetical protein